MICKGTVDNDAPVQHMSSILRVATRRILPSIRSFHPILAHRHFYTTQTPSPPPAAKNPPPKPKKPSASVPHATNVTGRDARHEVHEGTAALNIPFNPPGAGGPGIGGTLTGSALLDAAITTFIGLTFGKYTSTSSGTTSEY